MLASTCTTTIRDGMKMSQKYIIYASKRLLHNTHHTHFKPPHSNVCRIGAPSIVLSPSPRGVVTTLLQNGIRAYSTRIDPRELDMIEKQINMVEREHCRDAETTIGSNERSVH
ncbi:hypothetical protein SARC_03829, partial [Sphaeroforma arctica JP610]